MPQMAPLMWTSLFIFFTTTLFLMMIKVSFSKNKTSPSKEMKELIFNEGGSKLNWKW